MVPRRQHGLAGLFLLSLWALPPPAKAADRGRVYASIGLGTGSTDSDAKGNGFGPYGEVEYSLPRLDWLRFYAGGLYVATDRGSCGPDVVPCDISGKMLFLGGKIRLSAPIPYVRPFFNIGAGLSVGSATIRSGTLVNRHSEGVMPHIPIDLGLQFGNQVQIDVGFSFLFHPRENAVFGAAAIGFRFQLD